MTCRASLMTDCRSKITFSYAGASGNQDIFMLLDKFTFSESHDLIPVNVSVRMVMNFFNRSLIPKLSVPYQAFNTSVAPIVPFRIDERGNHFIGCVGFCLS